MRQVQLFVWSSFSDGTLCLGILHEQIHGVHRYGDINFLKDLLAFIYEMNTVLFVPLKLTFYSQKHSQMRVKKASKTWHFSDTSPTGCHVFEWPLRRLSNFVLKYRRLRSFLLTSILWPLTLFYFSSASSHVRSSARSPCCMSITMAWCQWVLGSASDMFLEVTAPSWVSSTLSFT